MPTEWVAVYELEPYSEARRAEFIEDAGRYICECPIHCFVGLGEMLDAPGGDSFLGLVAESEAELEAGEALVSGEPILVAGLPSDCTD